MFAANRKDVLAHRFAALFGKSAKAIFAAQSGHAMTECRSHSVRDDQDKVNAKRAPSPGRMTIVIPLC